MSRHVQSNVGGGNNSTPTRTRNLLPEKRRPLTVSGTCEAELQTLMVQVDRMVLEKKREWEMEYQKLEKILVDKETELQRLRLLSDNQKGQLLNANNQLKEQKSLYKAQIIEQHQNIDDLKNKVKDLYVQHDKLQKKHTRHQEDNAQKLHDLEAIRLKNENIVLQKNAELEQVKLDILRKTTDMEILRNQVKKLEDDVVSLQTNIEVISKQNVDYEKQLEISKQLLSNNDRSHKTQLEYADNQLKKKSDAVKSLSDELESLKKHFADQSKRLVEEDRTERLECDVEEARKTIGRLESEISSVTWAFKKCQHACNETKSKLHQSEKQCHEQMEEVDHLKELLRDAKRRETAMLMEQQKDLESLQQCRCASPELKESSTQTVNTDVGLPSRNSSNKVTLESYAISPPPSSLLLDPPNVYGGLGDLGDAYGRPPVDKQEFFSPCGDVVPHISKYTLSRMEMDASLAAEKFLQEERKKTKCLEDLIDHHVAILRQSFAVENLG